MPLPATTDLVRILVPSPQVGLHKLHSVQAVPVYLQLVRQTLFFAVEMTAPSWKVIGPILTSTFDPPIAVKFPFNAPTRIVRKELEANKVNETWESSTWKKRMVVKAKRAGLTDLDRFKLRKAKSARNKILAKALNSKKKTLRKAGKL